MALNKCPKLGLACDDLAPIHRSPPLHQHGFGLVKTDGPRQLRHCVYELLGECHAAILELAVGRYARFAKPLTRYCCCPERVASTGFLLFAVNLDLLPLGDLFILLGFPASPAVVRHANRNTPSSTNRHATDEHNPRHIAA